MEVMMPSPAGSSTCTSPRSPQGCTAANYFLNAPTYSSLFHRQISFSTTGCNTTLSQNPHNNFEEDEYDSTIDFAFDFGGRLDSTPSLSAEELFDGGKIKPLEPPPPRSPKRILKNAYEKAIIETRRDSTLLEGKDIIDQRGRERVYESSKTRRRQKNLSKSLSPLRNFNMVPEHINNERTSKQVSPSLITSSSSSSSSSSRWYGKWKLTDILLFRSASEGHATNKRYDLFRKISEVEDVKNTSFKSTDSSGLGSSGRRKNVNVPAHEWHYKVNRAATEEMRRKTFLPYKKNILMGCMDIDGGVCELF